MYHCGSPAIAGASASWFPLPSFRWHWVQRAKSSRPRATTSAGAGSTDLAGSAAARPQRALRPGPKPAARASPRPARPGQTYGVPWGSFEASSARERLGRRPRERRGISPLRRGSQDPFARLQACGRGRGSPPARAGLRRRRRPQVEQRIDQHARRRDVDPDRPGHPRQPAVALRSRRAGPAGSA